MLVLPTCRHHESTNPHRHGGYAEHGEMLDESRRVTFDLDVPGTLPPSEHVFEERRVQTELWFATCTDMQRRHLLDSLLLQCTPHQQRYVLHRLSGRPELQTTDFTTILPHAAALHVLSFLDPQSLSRCSQVGVCCFGC
eukprot:m.402198 g.402198  ORF g.402198 m.402198 type:complete len:139 (-) comp20117_c0_seq34:43-459(-)